MTETRRVWRVRGWVRLVAVAVPLVGLLFLFPPWAPNPGWQRDGMPASEEYWVVLVYAGLAVAVWSAFRSRIELDQGRLRVVNPLSSKVLLVADVVEVRPGSTGVEFVLASGRVVSAFAVQCTRTLPGVEPRWVDVARAVSGDQFSN